MSNESKRSSSSTPRVYKSTDVHKRRSSGSGRTGLFSRVPEIKATDKPAVPPTEEAAAQPEAEQAQLSAEQAAANAERQAALQSAVPQVEPVEAPTAEEAPAADDAPPAKPAEEIAKAVEEIEFDDSIDRQTFDTMPTTRLQAIGDFVNRRKQDLSGVSEGGQGADSSSPTLMEHAAFARQAGAAGANVAQIDPGRTADEAAKHRRTVVAVAAVIAVIVVAAIALFAWNRWGRFDDSVDIQGDWYVVGTTVPVQIDENSIKLTNDVSYEYTIDQNEKTIKYRFGTMEGQGRYWFSDNRQYLVITDGDNYSSASTTVEDLVRTFTELTATVSGQEVKLPEGDGIIAFSREPDPKAQAAKDQAAQKAKEEQEKQAAAAAKSDESESSDESASSASSSTNDDEEVDDTVYYDEDEEYYDEGSSTDDEGAGSDDEESEDGEVGDAGDEGGDDGDSGEDSDEEQ